MGTEDKVALACSAGNEVKVAYNNVVEPISSNRVARIGRSPSVDFSRVSAVAERAAWKAAQ